MAALRGAFSASTKLLAKDLTSTPDPAPNVLMMSVEAIV
jgi:hypothetical protein